MKGTISILSAAVIIIFICGAGMAATINVYYTSGPGAGARDENDTFLEGIINPDPNIWDGEYLGVNPLVQLLKKVGNVDDLGSVSGERDDILLAQITIGAGRYLTPFYGEWAKGSPVSVELNDPIYVRVFNGIDMGPEFGGTSSTYYGYSGIQRIKIVSGGPFDYLYIFPNLQTTDPLIPEPTTLLSGLALLLIRRGKSGS